MLSSASDIAKLFAKNFSKISNLDDLSISSPVFPSGTNLKLYNISKTPKIVKNVGKRSITKNYHPVSLLSVVSKVFEKLINNRIVIIKRNVAFVSDFQYGFRSSRSTSDLVTVVSDRIARVFNSFEATRAEALDISKAFDRV